MNRNLAGLLFFAACASAPAQVATLTRDQLIKYTGKFEGDRFPDGRPKVADKLLKKMDGLSAEEVWSVLPGEGYRNQYEGDFRILHPEKKLIGRAVTVQFMPTRPDIKGPNEADARAKGVINPGNQRVIDMLQEGDVLVADIFGKIEGGTFVGDNLATYIYAVTHKGMVVDGAIRDLEGIFPIPMGAYYRGVHPTPISQEVMITGINVPIRIGNATVLPGDVVFGDREGVYFVPPQLVGKILAKADELHIHDQWTQDKFLHETSKYKSSEIYGSPHDPKLRAEYQEYLKKKLEELHAKEGKEQ
ncbi:MAG: dimethylmenaquinone methyltransferase [Acidobacteriota bacterium]|nr:dimethylmenaquinone methyltransferase [Acidobacteriota bacterium]